MTREFVVDSGASFHMMSMTDVTPEDQETVTVSRRLTTAVTANRIVRTTEQANEHVKDLDIGHSRASCRLLGILAKE